MKLSELKFYDDGRIKCPSNGCDDCPIKQFTRKKGYDWSSDFVKAKGLTKKISNCNTVYHYAIKLEKLERILSL